MSLQDVLLKKGISERDLAEEEIKTLRKWQEQLNNNKLGIEDVEDHINEMIIGLEKELISHKTPKNITALLFRNKRNKHLMARLQNYLLLRDMLETPKKMQQRMENQLKHLK